MYTGQLKRMLVIALSVVIAAGLLAGCGGKDEPEPAAQAKQPVGMVPVEKGLEAGQTAADTAATAGSDARETGTSATGGVLQAPATVEAALKSTATKAEVSDDSAARNPLSRPQLSNGTGAYSLQLGSFRSEENAWAQVLRIQELGYKPTVEVASLAGQTYHRVVLRGLADRNEAERLGEHVRSELGITYLIRQK